MSAIKLRVIRPCCFRGQRCEIDDVISVDPLQARDMLCSGRVELRDPADARLMAEAGRAELRQQLRHQPAAQLPPGPWLPLNH